MDAQNKPMLLAQLDNAAAIEIGWGSVAEGKDILILKSGFEKEKATKVALPLTEATKAGWDVGSIPVARQAQPGVTPVCPTCGTKGTWIGEYGRWYCAKERKYL